MTEQPTEQTTEATGTQATGEEEPRCAFPKCPARPVPKDPNAPRSEEHTSELQSQSNLVCRLLLEKKKKIEKQTTVLKQANRRNSYRIHAHYLHLIMRPTAPLSSVLIRVHIDVEPSVCCQRIDADE